MGAMVVVDVVLQNGKDLEENFLVKVAGIKYGGMGLRMGKMWRWVMCGTRTSHRDKKVILIPNDHNASNGGPHASLGAVQSQCIARTERQRLPRCDVELAIDVRFSSSPVFAPVFSLSVGLMSQVQFSTLRCLL
jgi:hypothetical protein